MKPEELEQKMNKTLETIEAGLVDIKANKATKSEVIALIDEKTAEDKAAFKAAQEESVKSKSTVDELKEQTKQLETQLKQLRASGFSSLKDSNGNYKGMYGSIQEAKTFGLLLMAAATANTKATSAHEAAVKALEKLNVQPKWLDTQGRKTLSTSSLTGGSALVTVEQSPGFLRMLETYGVYRRNAANVPMGAAQTTVPKIDSLLTIYCPGEGVEIIKSDPTIPLLSLTPKTMNALTAYSMELDEDSAVGLAELLGPLFARSFAYYEDLCGFLGDGTATYFAFKGIAGALRAVDATIGNIKGLTVGSGNAYSELVIGDFEGLVGNLPQYADEDGFAKHYMHRYFYYTVFVKLALAAGGATASEIILGAGSRQKSALGYPVEFSQVMPRAEANSQICNIFGNLNLGAMLGTRGGVEFAQSAERYFELGLIAVRGRNRVAINAHGVGDTTKAGPIVGLITAAS